MKNCCDTYCANHGCNQGRNCPARVASIGKKMHGPEPLSESPWRRQLKILAKWMLIAICVLSIMSIGAVIGFCLGVRA